MFIYIIQSQSGPVKIGYSQDPEKRLKQLQTGSSDKLTLHAKINVEKEHVKLLEKTIHRMNSHKRIDGEWFDLNPDDAVRDIEFAIISFDPVVAKYKK